MEKVVAKKIVPWLVVVLVALVLTYLGNLLLADTRRVTQVVQGDQDLGAGIELIRRLAASNDYARLAETLDRSMVSIPAGEFLRGSDTGRWDERPQHPVFLDAFEIDRYEVTNVQFQRFLKVSERKPLRYWNGDEYPSGQADYPVVGVTWSDADAYCTWVGKRLPTEAEWEKACRGTDGRAYPWGNDWEPRRANIAVPGITLQSAPVESDAAAWDAAWRLLQATPSAGKPGLVPVGTYRDGASPYGVMDLVGNASEWVTDWYNWSDYSKMPTRNPRVLEPPWNHALRGGSWYDPSADAVWVQSMSRCPARSSSHADWDPRVGFRCAR